MLIVLIGAAWLCADAHIDASRLIADLALLTIAVAARERRHGAMLAAAGIACGITLWGAILLPVAIGVALARRARPAMLLLVPLAAALTALAGLPPVAGAAPVGLWSIRMRPEHAGLLIAIAVGWLAWATAALSARPLSATVSMDAAMACALAGAMTMPGGSMALPLALAVGCGDRRVRILTGLAAALALYGLPVTATLALGIALWLAARPLLETPANDNWRFAPMPV